MDSTEKHIQAINTLVSQVYHPAFFKRAAEHGIVPTSQEEAEMMLDTALRVKTAQHAALSHQNNGLHKAANTAARRIVGDQSGDDDDDVVRRYRGDMGEIRPDIVDALNTIGGIRV